MKKIIYLYICFLGFLCMSISVNVLEVRAEERLTKWNSDYEEIMLLIPDIKKDLHETFEMENVNVSIDSLEIRLEEAKKVYIDTPIFSLESSDVELVSRLMKMSEYVWVIPVYVDQDTYFVNIARGMPLDESKASYLSQEQIERIKEEEGKWTVSGIQYYENEHINYDRIIDEALEAISYDEDATVLLCGGLEQIQNPAAIIMDDTDVELIIPLFDLPIQGTEEQIAKLKPTEAKESDEIYKYEELRNTVMNMDEEEKEMSGGIGIILKPEKGVDKKTIIFVIVLISIITIIASLIIKKKFLKGKKIISFLLFVFCCFFLSGCGGNDVIGDIGFQNFELQDIQRAEVSLYTEPNHTDTAELSRQDIEKIVNALGKAEIHEIDGEDRTAISGGVPIFEFNFENGDKKRFFVFKEWLAYEKKSYRVGSEVCRQLDEISYGLLPEDVGY